MAKEWWEEAPVADGNWWDAAPVAKDEPRPYRDRVEALDDAVNFVEEGQPLANVAKSFGNVGLTEQDIVSHGRQRGSELFANSLPTTGVAPESSKALKSLEPTATQEFLTNPLRRGMAAASRTGDILAKETGVIGNEAAAGLVAKRNKAIQAAAPGSAIQAGQEAISKAGEKGLSDAAVALATNPAATWTMLLESVVSSTPSIATSVAGSIFGPIGSAAGAGLGSFATEYGSTVFDSMAETGLNPANPADIQKAFENPEVMSAARSKAAKRGIAVASFDALTAGLAGRFFKPAMGKVQIAREINGGSVAGLGAGRVLASASAKEAGVQAAGGMAGEALAQGVTDGKLNYSNILLEGLAEVPGGAVEVAQNMAFGGRDQKAISFTPANSITRQAGLPEIVVPVKEQNTNVSLRDAPTGLAGDAGQQTSVEPIPSVGDLRPSADNGGRGNGDGTGGMAPTDGTLAPVRNASGQPIAFVEGDPLVRSRDGDLLSRAEAQSPQAEQAQPQAPVTIWAGRAGDGYADLEAAQAGLQTRIKRDPDLRWEVEQMPGGKYRLAGYDQQAVTAQQGDVQGAANSEQMQQKAPSDAPAEAQRGLVSSEDQAAQLPRAGSNSLEATGVAGAQTNTSPVGSVANVLTNQQNIDTSAGPVQNSANFEQMPQQSAPAKPLDMRLVPMSKRAEYASSIGQATQPAPSQPAPSFTDKPDGTLAVAGDPKALKQQLIDAGIPSQSIMKSKTGVLIGRSQVAKVRDILSPPQNTQATQAASRVKKEDIPKAANLSTEDAAIEDRFRQKLTDDFESAVREYSALPQTNGGKILNVDDARELSPDYLKDRTKSAAVHEPASWFMKQLYARKLSEPLKPGESPIVLFTAGGTGAGKTTGIQSSSVLQSISDRAHIIYDTNMNGRDSSIAKIEKALDANMDVRVVLVVRDPVDALVNGALPRAERQRQEFGTGRTVPVSEHIKTHKGAVQTVRQLAVDYADNPSVKIDVLDNSFGKAKAQERSIDWLGSIQYDGVESRVLKALENEYENGRISEGTYRGFAGNAQETRPDKARSGSPSADRSVLNRSTEGVSSGSERGNQQAVDGSQPIADTSPDAARNIGTLARSIVNFVQRRGLDDSLSPYEGRQLRDATTLRAISSAFGTELQGFGLSPNLSDEQKRRYGFFNGGYLKGTVYIRDEVSNRPHLSILGHELAHSMARQQPALYADFVDAIDPYIKSNYSEFADSAVAGGLKDAALREEFMGEVLADAFMDKDFWRTIGDRSPSLLRRVADFATKLIDKALASVGYNTRSEKYLTDFKRVKQIAAEVMAEYSRQQEPASDESGNTSFSRSQDTIEVDGIQRPRTNSKGQPIHPTEDGVRNFWRWFSNSKVVDEDGKPLVVYHGTTGDFEAFARVDGGNAYGPGYYFTASPAEASGYADGTGGGRIRPAGSAAPNVMPVYLSVRNVYALDNRVLPQSELAKLEAASNKLNPGSWKNGELAKAFDRAYPPTAQSVMQYIAQNAGGKYSKIAQVAGYDGLRGAYGFVAFKPEQIKSATGNQGTFDPDNADIRFSRTTLGNAAQGQRFNLPEDGATAITRIKLQDDALRMKRVIDAVKEQGGTVGEEQNFYDANTLMPGRVQSMMDDFRNDAVLPMLKKAAKADIRMDELSLYAYARHAEERNAYIASINPKMPDGGSGMTNADAQAIMAEFERGGKAAEYADLHSDLMGITAATRRTMLDEGLITQEQHDTMDGQYDNYMPLRGFENVEPETGVARPGVGRGINVRGKETIRALGRRSRAGDLIENVIRDYQRVVVKSEKNNVGKVFLDFVLSNPDPDLWGVDVEKGKATLNKATGQVEYGNTIDKGEDTVGVKVAGQQVYIQIKDKALARAMRHAWKDETGDLERAAVAVSGWYSTLLRNVLTRYNPPFAVVNTIRDAQSGAVAALDELGARGAKRFAFYYPKAVAASYRGERGWGTGTIFNNPVMDKYFTEFKNSGAITGGFFMKDLGDIASDLRSDLLQAGAAPKSKSERVRASTAFKASKKLLSALEFMGTVSENTTRFALYMAARDSGRTPSEAALLAKNGTTNFNRKGEWGGTLNALYLFFNAAVQGNAQLFKTLKNPKVRAALSVVAGVGVAAAMFGASGGGEDDDGQAYWDKIPDYEKERNLIIMLPPGDTLGRGVERVGQYGRYIKIPVQYGLNFFPNIGYMMADVYRNQQDASSGKTLAKATKHMLSVTFGSVNPFGGSVDVTDSVSLAMALAPTILDLPIMIGTERNSFGTPVAPSRFPGDTKPDSERMFSSDINTLPANIAKAMNDMGGGNEAKPGKILGVETSVTPGTIKNLIGATTGGLGIFGVQTWDVAAGLIGDEGVRRKGMEPSNWPVFNKVYGEVGQSQNIRLAGERMREVRDVSKLIDDQLKSGIAPEVSNDEKKIFALSSAQETYQKEMARLRKEEIAVLRSPDMADERKRLALDNIKAAQDALSVAVNRAYLKQLGPIKESEMEVSE